MIFSFLLVPVVSKAQKKEIVQAKEWIKKKQNLDKAQQSMEKLLKDSANRQNEKIYLVLFDAIKAQYEEGNEKLYLKQKYDTALLFNNALRMFQVLESLDSLDMTPDKKGRVKLKYRDDHAQYLSALRPNLYNGGLYYIHKQKYEEAYRFLEAYIDCARQPLFSSLHYDEKDPKIASASYWAVYCGYKMQNPKATLRHTYMALKDTAHYNLMLQYLADTYRIEKDTTRCLQTLQEGFEKYPEFPFFFPRLLSYYSQNRMWDKALALSDTAMSINPKNNVFVFARSTVLLNTGKYSESLALCDTLFARGDTLPDIYLNAGLAWFNQGVELDKNITTSRKTRSKIITCYKNALPYLETYRKKRPEAESDWTLPLYTIYLNLNMGKEFDEIDQILRKQNTDE
jgi:tetratricopeptide (TPR) repeat protein